MNAHYFRLACSAALLPLLAGLAAAQPKSPPADPELTMVTGVIKEVNLSRKTITFIKKVEGSYGTQQVTDLMALHPDFTITVDGKRVLLKDLRVGDHVVFECLPKPERALRIAALSPEELERLQKEKDRIKEFERKVEADHLRLIKELARKQFAKDIERDKEKDKAKVKPALKTSDRAKKDPPKNDPPD